MEDKELVKNAYKKMYEGMIAKDEIILCGRSCIWRWKVKLTSSAEMQLKENKR